MSWSTLPNPPPPSFRWNEDAAPILMSARFGDDYGQDVIDGIVAAQSSGTLTYTNLNESEKETIDGFFNGLLGTTPFLFQPPSESVARTWKCKVWGVDVVNGHIYNVTAKIERCYDVDG